MATSIRPQDPSCYPSALCRGFLLCLPPLSQGSQALSHHTYYSKIDLELMEDDSPRVPDRAVGQAAQVLPGIKVSPGKGGI